MTFDLASLDYVTACEQPYEFELVHPVEKTGLGIFFSVIGAESGTFQSYVRTETNAARQRAFDQRKSGKETPSTVDEDEAAMIKALAVCIKGWRTGKKPVLLWSGRELEFTPENVVTVMRQFKWMREQVNEATGELGNFIGNGSRAS